MAAGLGMALTLAACGGGSTPIAASKPPKAAQAPRATVPTTDPDPTSTSDAPPTTTSAPTTTTTPGTHGPLTSPPLPAPGVGFVAGQVTAIGDSVMIDYQTALQQDIPGVNVQATVSKQWGQGEDDVQQMKAAGQLGAVVIVGLGTNGPITAADFDAMMAELSGASRVVFVNVHVDRTWQDGNNAVLAAGVARYPNTVLADWNTLASQNTGWFYATQTHLPINGPGAQALASLVAGKA
ncbi:MAG TPA: hypothetical protein VHB02_05515 [Acidimicrobiales bacterium]|nr:hypothetical protein [Acidimicrobiales bacterium]